MHEGFHEHTESLAALQREFAKPFPDRAHLYRFLSHALPGCVSDCLAGMRDDLRRWAAQVNAADARALAAWRPSLNAVAARLDDLCERYLLLERCIRARFSGRELWEAHHRSLRAWHASPEFQAWVAAGAPAHRATTVGKRIGAESATNRNRRSAGWRATAGELTAQAKSLRNAAPDSSQEI